MDPDFQAYVDWLRGHGVRCEPGPEFRKLKDHDEPLVGDPSPVVEFDLNGVGRIREYRDPAHGIAADHATSMVAQCLSRSNPDGARFVDVGCGTGVLGVIAHRLGAADVTGTDLDARAVDLAARTADAAGVPTHLYVGSLLDAVPPDIQFDVIVANLPHKPCPEGSDLYIAQRGGPDGCQPHLAMLDCFETRLAPGGRVLFFLHSLPDPRLLRTYQERMDIVPLAWKRRFLRENEYGALTDVFLSRAAEGSSFVGEKDGRHFLVACVWMARAR